MQTTTAQVPQVAGAMLRPATRSAGAASAYQGYQILRRNGAVVSFEPNKIAVALMKAFLAVHGTQGAASASVRETVDGLTESVVRALLRSRPGGGTFHIEDVQDQVELGLMRGGHHEVARAYVLYRERRAQERPGLVRALRRYALFLASITLSVLHGPSYIADFAWFFGCIAVIFTQHKQALHDKLAGTYVIRT